MLRVPATEPPIFGMRNERAVTPLEFVVCRLLHCGAHANGTGRTSVGGTRGKVTSTQGGPRGAFPL